MATTLPPTPAAPVGAANRPAFAQALRDGALGALVMAGLATPILLFRTDQSQANELFLQPRVGLVAIFCAIIFALRFAVSYYNLEIRPKREAKSRGEAIRKAAAGEPEAAWKRALRAVALPLFLEIGRAHV